MSYAYDPNLEDDKDQQDASTQLAGGDQVVGAGAPGTAQAGAQAKDPNAPTKSDSFQNLNDYIDANDSAAFGKQFVGKVQGDVDTAGATQAASAQKFKQQSDAGSVTSDPSLVDSAAADPYGFTQDPSKVAAFTKQRDATYSGPASYADSGDAYQQAFSATKKASDAAQNAQTEGGRFALLDNYFGRPDYTPGQKGLDNLLVSGTQSTQDSIKQAAQNAQTAQAGFQKQAGELSDYAAGNIGKTEKAGKYVQDNFAPKVGETQKQYQERLDKYVKDRDSSFNADKTALSTPNGDYKSILEKFGAGPASRSGAFGQSDTGYWGVTPGNYLSEAAQPTLSSATSVEDQRKLNALEQLMGQQQTSFDASQAGKYDPAHPDSLTGLDTEGLDFKTALQHRQDAYGEQEAAAKQKMDSIRNAPVQITGHGDPYAGQQAQIQQQLDGLNALRAQYGLAPIANPYNWNSPPPSGGGAGPILPF